MTFDGAMITDLRALAGTLQQETDEYLSRLGSIAEGFLGRESALEDITYDFDDAAVRLEAMMVCKLMPTMPRLRIYEDLALAESDAKLKEWAGIMFRQEHLNETAKRFVRERNA